MRHSNSSYYDMHLYKVMKDISNHRRAMSCNLAIRYLTKNIEGLQNQTHSESYRRRSSQMGRKSNLKKLNLNFKFEHDELEFDFGKEEISFQINKKHFLFDIVDKKI